MVKRDVLKNGTVKLSSPIGIVDTRTNAIYSEVICKPKNEKYYREAEEEAEVTEV